MSHRLRLYSQCAIFAILVSLGFGCAGNGAVWPSSEVGLKPQEIGTTDLRQGAEVCAHLRSGETLCGKVTALGADTVTIGHRGSRHGEGRTVARSEIESLERASRSSVAGAVTTGLAIVALGGLAMLALLSSARLE